MADWVKSADLAFWLYPLTFPWKISPVLRDPRLASRVIVQKVTGSAII